MTASFSARALRGGITVLAAGALALSLSACANPNPVPATSAQASTPASEPTTPTPSASAELHGVKLTLTCNDVLSPDTLYSLNGGANWANDDSFVPSSGSTAAEIVDLGGIACGYTHQTSGETFTIAVAEVSPESIQLLHSKLESAFGAGTAVKDFSPTGEISGYFHTVDGTGEAQIATSAYWASISSKTYESASDVSDLVHDVETSLGR